jgi:hypothetical protein
VSEIENESKLTEGDGGDGGTCPQQEAYSDRLHDDEALIKAANHGCSPE